MFSISFFILTNYKNFLLLGMAYNNFGVYYFHNDDLIHAKSYWEIGLKHSIKSKSKYLQAIILANLSSIYSSEGRIHKAMELLRKAEIIYTNLNSLEGQAHIEHCLTLINIENGQIEDALYHFERSLSVANPLPPPLQRLERYRVVIKTIKKYKYGSEDTIVKFQSLFT